MRLDEVTARLFTAELRGEGKTTFTGIAADSRKVQPGDLFVCIPGNRVDGHDFAEEAMKRGASALMVERWLNTPLPQIRVRDIRRASALLAAHFLDHPTHHLRLIGVTGTNGKTTITHLLEQIFSRQQFRTGLIGTIRHKVGDRWLESMNTTPDAIDLQLMFKEMVMARTDYALMEVSSHALELGRVRGCRFRTAIFTNLTQDHLDFHGNMEQYLLAKSLLFSQLGNSYEQWQQFAVLNADDPAADMLQKVCAQPIITYGIEQGAEVMAREIELGSGHTSFVLDTFRGKMKVRMKLVGKFSIYNALAATSAALLEEIPLENIVRTLEQVPGVPGRFERVDEGQPFTVIVDYAHTPDSLENVLRTIGAFARKRVFCVVGCGGERDRTKRPLMAEVAVNHSDHAIFTADNPRREPLEQILSDMIKGVEGRTGWTVVEDRKQAIEEAVFAAEEGDVVLIAGKGHETYQLVGEERLHFDDRLVAREAIRKRGYRA